MLYVQLDVNWPDNHKIIDVGIEGAGLHAIVLCLAKRQETDGWVRRRLLYRQGASDDLIDRVAEAGLLDVDGDLVRPHGWLDRNPSQAAIEARRVRKAENARRGNHERWEHPGPFEECPKCQVVAPSDPVDRTSESNASPEPKPEPTPDVRSDPVLEDPQPDDVRSSERIAAAARLSAERRAAVRTDIGPGWVPSVAESLYAKHRDQLTKHLERHPDASVEELADVIDQRPSDRPEPVNTSSFLPSVLDVLAERPERASHESMVEGLAFLQANCRRPHPATETGAAAS